MARSVSLELIGTLVSEPHAPMPGYRLVLCTVRPTHSPNRVHTPRQRAPTKLQRTHTQIPRTHTGAHTSTLRTHQRILMKVTSCSKSSRCEAVAMPPPLRLKRAVLVASRRLWQWRPRRTRSTASVDSAMASVEMHGCWRCQAIGGATRVVSGREIWSFGGLRDA